MDTEYCDKCGLLHDPSDGNCLGCEMVKEIKLLKKTIKAQAKMILHYKIGKHTMPDWVFVSLKKAKDKYGPNLMEIVYRKEISRRAVWKLLRFKSTS